MVGVGLFDRVINAKYALTVQMMENWGYKLVDEIVWIKKTINGKIAKGHGFYLQHAKETCLVGVKNEAKIQFNRNTGPDVIFSERRGQSQKPNEIYEMIEEMIPNGKLMTYFRVLSRNIWPQKQLKKQLGYYWK